MPDPGAYPGMNLRDAFDPPVPTVVLGEGEFGQPVGKTANGVVLQSDLFDARAVVDSTRAGRSAAEVLGRAGGAGDRAGGAVRPDAGRTDLADVPVVGSMAAALDAVPEAEALVLGVAPAGGALPEAWESGIRAAMRAGCDVVSGLHVFLSADPEWADLADDCGVRIFDVREPPPDEDLRVADGRVDDLAADVVLAVGTDCAVGKRTTTVALCRAARRAGLDAGWVATGQTGIMVGADRGVVVDRVPADFAAGVVEELVCAVGADREVVFVEGQGALTHRAYSGVTLSILHGAWPDAVVLVDEPGRDRRVHFEQFSVRGVEVERQLVHGLSEAAVAGVSTWGDPGAASDRYGLPAANVFEDGGPEALLAAVRDVL